MVVCQLAVVRRFQGLVAVTLGGGAFAWRCGGIPVLLAVAEVAMAKMATKRLEGYYRDFMALLRKTHSQLCALVAGSL